MPGTPELVLAFDFGQRRIGVAVGQDVTGSASPLGIIDNRDGDIDFAAIDRLVAEWRPVRLIVGMPLNADDSAGPLGAAVRAFVAALERYRLPIVTTDERYSSIEAERLLQKARADGRRGHIDKAAIDAAAAVLIAERYLAGAP